MVKCYNEIQIIEEGMKQIEAGLELTKSIIKNLEELRKDGGFKSKEEYIQSMKEKQWEKNINKIIKNVKEAEDFIENMNKRPNIPSGCCWRLSDSTHYQIEYLKNKYYLKDVKELQKKVEEASNCCK